MDSKTALKIARAAFPQWKGRKVTVNTTGTASVYGTFWDGGTKNEYAAIDLATGRISHADNALGTPAEMGGKAGDYKTRVPVGVAVVQWSVFCGRDCGCTVYLAAPDSLPAGTIARELSA